MGYKLLINAVYLGCNPFTNHLPTSWDIQVISPDTIKLLGEGTHTQSPELSPKQNLVATSSKKSGWRCRHPAVRPIGPLVPSKKSDPYALTESSFWQCISEANPIQDRKAGRCSSSTIFSIIDWGEYKRSHADILRDRIPHNWSIPEWLWAFRRFNRAQTRSLCFATRFAM